MDETTCDPLELPCQSHNGPTQAVSDHSLNLMQRSKLSDQMSLACAAFEPLPADGPGDNLAYDSSNDADREDPLCGDDLEVAPHYTYRLTGRPPKQDQNYSSGQQVRKRQDSQQMSESTGIIADGEGAVDGIAPDQFVLELTTEEVQVLAVSARAALQQRTERRRVSKRLPQSVSPTVETDRMGYGAEADLARSALKDCDDTRETPATLCDRSVLDGRSSGRVYDGTLRLPARSQELVDLMRVHPSKRMAALFAAR